MKNDKCPKCAGEISEVRMASVVYRACAVYDAEHYFEEISLPCVLDLPTLDYTGWGSCYADNSDSRYKGKLCQGTVRYVAGVGTCPTCGVTNRLVEPASVGSGENRSSENLAALGVI